MKYKVGELVWNIGLIGNNDQLNLHQKRRLLKVIRIDNDLPYPYRCEFMDIYVGNKGMFYEQELEPYRKHKLKRVVK